MDVGIKALDTMTKPADKYGAGERNVPVTSRGITFKPGHPLVADKDGVIVLPTEWRRAISM